MRSYTRGMTEHDYHQALLEFASNIAQDAGAIMREYFHRPEQGVETKANKTLVTEADTKINQLVIECVNEHYPDHGVLGEEDSVRTDRPELWVCDPIDGTNGFVYGLPTSVFSLAYVRDGSPQVAVILDPFQQRLFTAAKGQGAYCNGRPIHVSRRTMAESYIAGPGGLGEFEQYLEMYRALHAEAATVRLSGGFVFQTAQIAEGRMDGRVFNHNGAHDVAAAKLIVEEAGGKVTDLDGNEQPYNRPLRGAIISNGLIHDDLVRLVRQTGVSSLLSA
jgi:myo-inositol-1(or 4)-monophosphatase